MSSYCTAHWFNSPNAKLLRTRAKQASPEAGGSASLMGFVVVPLLGGMGLGGWDTLSCHPVCPQKQPLGRSWTWFPGLQGMQG